MLAGTWSLFTERARGGSDEVLLGRREVVESLSCMGTPFGPLPKYQECEKTTITWGKGMTEDSCCDLGNLRWSWRFHLPVKSVRVKTRASSRPTGSRVFCVIIDFSMTLVRPYVDEVTGVRALQYTETGNERQPRLRKERSFRGSVGTSSWRKWVRNLQVSARPRREQAGEPLYLLAM